jgi:hypothetical protein
VFKEAAAVALALCLGAGAACGGGLAPAPHAARATAKPSPAAASPTTIPLVPPSVVPANFGSSGLPAPAGVTTSRAAPPVRLRIPAIGVDSSLQELDVGPDGTIDVPSDASRPGWYSRGPVPGETGPAVILGHLDSYSGPAVFYRLSSLHPGDAVLVGTQDGSEWSFSVQRVATFSADAFPTSQVYGATPDPELRLITCGGTYSLSRRQYLANVVAFASLGANGSRQGRFGLGFGSEPPSADRQG